MKFVEDIKRKIKLAKDVGPLNAIKAKLKKKEIKIKKKIHTEESHIETLKEPVVIHIDTTEKEPKETSTTPRIYNKGGF